MAQAQTKGTDGPYTESQNQDQESGEADSIGRGLVRRLLIERLRAAGLTRAKGQTEAALSDMLDHLTGQLDHMTADNLMTLADAVLDQAAQVGPAQGQWPREVMIIAWARGLQARPFRLSRIITSWLASIEGPIAEAAGYEVQLLRFLRRHQRPPTTFDIGKCKEEAREDNRLMCIVSDRIARGAVQQPDRDWHAAYLADQQMARTIIDRGQAGRIAQPKDSAA